jgi:hypothetical protein
VTPTRRKACGTTAGARPRISDAGSGDVSRAAGWCARRSAVRMSLLLAALSVLFGVSACAAADAAPMPSRPRPTRTVAARVTATPTPTPTPTPQGICPVPPLVMGQHLSSSGSYTETEKATAGPMVCRVEPGSCAYHYLIGNLDPSIVFKREESPPYTTEDILMHPDMLLPLLRLSELVQAEWSGAVRLRVTDAYDSLLEHDLAQTDPAQKSSLHFEGRSIDLTTWPIDLTLYGRLCALAHCAGFHWVLDEGDHCHASLRAESLCTRCGN